MHAPSQAASSVIRALAGKEIAISRPFGWVVAKESAVGQLVESRVFRVAPQATAR